MSEIIITQSCSCSFIPQRESSPPSVQMIKDSPMDPTPLIMTFGEMKIPVNYVNSGTAL